MLVPSALRAGEGSFGQTGLCDEEREVEEVAVGG